MADHPWTARQGGVPRIDKVAGDPGDAALMSGAFGVVREPGQDERGQTGPPSSVSPEMAGSAADVPISPSECDDCRGA